ncbi:glycosyltransferase family 4 protein [Gudongella sp. DL1XJH-153]|uniref:glycosyltransferase family 4 protein n=1 Tax=Gudongella sp. DL1XJH-153 TaxID=3409804 RepID=UPI003BB6A7DF
MKILHITSQYPGKTGSGTYLKAMITEAHKNGYRQGLLGAVQEGLDYDNPILEYLDMIHFNTTEIPFPIMGMSDKMPYRSSVYKDMSIEDIDRWENEFTRKFEDAVESFNPDVILSHHLWLGTSVVAKLSRDIPVYGICHGTDIRQFLKINRLAERVAKELHALEGVFALTVDQKTTIERLYNIPFEKIHLAGGGYDENIFYPPENKKISDRARLVYAGKLSHAKGLIPLLDAYENLQRIHPVDLTMAGSGQGEEKEEIYKRGNELGVKFTGALSQVELADLFRESDIFVLPSYYEGLPLVTMEALACGLMVVTTDIPGLKSYMGEKLATSGLVSFVKLPRMMDVDTPLHDDYNQFVFNLKKTLDIQINNHHDGYNNVAPFKREVEKLSWKGVFERISNAF